MKHYYSPTKYDESKLSLADFENQDVIVTRQSGIFQIRIRTDSNNAILEYRYQNGKLPILPKELMPIFPEHKSEQPVSKIMVVIPPSAQFLARLSYNQPVVEFLFSLLEWQGKDPRTYVAGSIGYPIVWNGENPKEWARDYITYWKSIIHPKTGN